jgi:hypothetical protein
MPDLVKFATTASLAVRCPAAELILDGSECENVEQGPTLSAAAEKQHHTTVATLEPDCEELLPLTATAFAGSIPAMLSTTKKQPNKSSHTTMTTSSLRSPTAAAVLSFPVLPSKVHYF